jgi:hypothetical protein
MLASGCVAPVSDFCATYRRVPLTLGDIGRISLPALRAVEANERKADRCI